MILPFGEERKEWWNSSNPFSRTWNTVAFSTNAQGGCDIYNETISTPCDLRIDDLIKSLLSLLVRIKRYCCSSPLEN